MSDTRRTATESEILTNRSELFARLADDLAHEIKNPIHSMVINLELVRRRILSGAPDVALDRVAIVEQETDRVHRIIDALLLLLRPPRDGDAADVDRTLRELLPLLEARARLARASFHYQPADVGSAVPLPRNVLKHVVLNLFTNAVDALGGRPGGSIELRCALDDGDVRVLVLDTGPGIDAASLGRMGEVGFTTRPGRAGLGLAVARTLVRDGGGSLVLGPAADGSGTVATLTLPLAARA